MKTSLLLSTATLLSASVLGVAAKERPNVIFIMADDLGWGDVGFNGNTIIKTPCLDALSAQGVVFDRFYSACAVSSPTRSSVLTGRNPYRSGVFHANVGILRQEEISIAEVLKAEGYMTGHFGKWHLGTLTDTQRDANRGRVGNSAELNRPSLHGYDDSFVTESKVPTFDPMISPTQKKGSFWDYIKDGEERRDYGTAYWRHDGVKETENLAGDDSRVIMDRVIPFIDRAVASDKPFASVVWFHTPHLPCVAGPKEQEIYKDYPLDKRNYYGCITAMDEQIGRLVDYLKQSGQAENTIIFFCSDNGPEGNASAPGVTAGLRGRKRSLYEGGIRVPAFVVWGDNFKGVGERVLTPAFTSDYMPTLMDICGIKRAANTHLMDGESMMPILKKGRERKRPMVFVFQGQAAVVGNRYKLYFAGKGYELYDIVEDRAESVNIADKHPDIVAEYRGVLEEHIVSYRDSFEGREFDVRSPLPQKWTDPLSIAAAKKQ